MKTEVTYSRPITWRMTYEQVMVLHNEVTRSRRYDRHYAEGRKDRLAGLPCRSANGAYIDGWYGV